MHLSGAKVHALAKRLLVSMIVTPETFNNHLLYAKSPSLSPEIAIYCKSSVLRVHELVITDLPFACQLNAT